MESNLCGSSNLVSGSDNVNVNEATPAETSVEVHEATDVSAQSVECDNAISSTTPDKFTENLNEVERNLLNMEGNETEDFFTKELNISGVPTEKITENVEDIVQDLENLLGESNDSYRFSREPFDSARLTESFDEVNSSSTSNFTKESSLSSSKKLNLLQHVDITASNSNTQEKEEKINQNKDHSEVLPLEELKQSEILTTEVSENVQNIQPSEISEKTTAATPSLEFKETEQTDKMTLDVVVPEQSLSEIAASELTEREFTGPIQEVCLEFNLNENESAIEVDDCASKIAGESSETIESKSVDTIVNSKELWEPSNLEPVRESEDTEEKLPDSEITGIVHAVEIDKNETAESALETEVKPTLVEELVQENLETKSESEMALNEFVTATQNQELQETKLDLDEPLQEIECDHLQMANESEPILHAATENESFKIIQGVEAQELSSNQSEVALETLQNISQDLQPPMESVQETFENIQENIEEKSDLILDEPKLIQENTSENQQVKESVSSNFEELISKDDIQAREELRASNVIQEIMEIDDDSTEAQSQTLDQSLPELSCDETAIDYITEHSERNVLEVESSSSEVFPAIETIMEESGIVTSTSSEMQLVPDLEIERQNDVEMLDEPLQDNASQLLEELIKDSCIDDGFNALLDENNDKDMLTEITSVQTPQVEVNLSSNQESEDLQAPVEETEIGVPDESLINQQPQDWLTSAEEIKINIPSQSSDVKMQESTEIVGQSSEEEKENENVFTEDVSNILDALTETANDTVSETQAVDSSIPDVSTSTENQNIHQTDMHLSHNIEFIEVNKNQDAELLEANEEAIKQVQDVEPIQMNQCQTIKPQETNQSQDLQVTEKNQSQDLPVTETNQDVEIVESSENDDQIVSSIEKVNLVQPLTVQVDEENSTEIIQTEEKETVAEETDEKKIKPEIDTVSGSTEQVTRAPLKMTITKSDNVHSILKIYDPNENQEQLSSKRVVKSVASSSTTEEDQVIPKITIKAVLTSPEIQHSPKSANLVKSLKSQNLELPEKQCSPRSSKSSGAGSPRITIKPVVKPETLSPLKLTLKPYPKLEEMQGSPKLNIKPVVKPEESSLEVVHSPKITIKPIIKPPEESNLEEKFSIRMKSAMKLEENREDTQHEERHSPRITIKPIIKSQEELKEESQMEERHSPKITIKPIVKPSEELVREESNLEGRHSPKITIKPIVKRPEENEEQERPAKIIIKPVVKSEEEKHTPKVTIKPIVKPSDSNKIGEGETSRMSTRNLRKDEVVYVENKPSPRITIKPVVKSPDENARSTSQTLESKSGARIISEKTNDERHSPRITFKPIVKPEHESENISSPRITIKPVLKPDSEQSEKYSTQPLKLNIKPVVKPESSSPKVTIKPIAKSFEPESDMTELVDFEEQIKQERIVLKIAKSGKKEKELEKLKKIKVKLSKEHGGHARIIPQSAKRSGSLEGLPESKHFKAELFPEVSLSFVSSTVNSSDAPSSTTEFKKAAAASKPDIEVVSIQNKEATIDLTLDDDVDPLADIPVFQIAVDTATVSSGSSVQSTPEAATAPRKRGRPRKVPLQVREEFKDTKEDEAQPAVVVSSRPKRSCRGASVKEALGIKPRKPRATPAVRGGRGGKKAAVATTRAPPAKKSRESKTSPSKVKLQKDEVVVVDEESKEFEPQVVEAKEEETKDAEFKQVPVPAELAAREVVIYEEETRMSAENSSRAQTPAKQVLSSTTEVVEESQSSVQSNTTTESGEKVQKVRKGPRLEVHQEPEGEIISADKLAEYSWGGGGPYMLQEQVAQFLGIKSFKRKYPGIQRRPVDMQERDFIRESCLASEAMCDMGLTAVRSEDILDIMYTDFQHKYEEYCKHQRDRQAKEVSNKQKALSLAASQEKNKLDIVEQAVQSAYQWNANFNKIRKEQRRACMDLQTFTVHFPKGKMKQVNRIPVGNYPLALVPGQFTDYYKQYNTFELANLPLNTMGCKPLTLNNLSHDTEESQSDGSGSDSDSSSSDSDSSDSSSGAEDCKMCRRTAAVSARKVLAH